MGKLIRKATGLTVGVATLLAGLVLPMTASAESASTNRCQSDHPLFIR